MLMSMLTQIVNMVLNNFLNSIDTMTRTYVTIKDEGKLEPII